MVQIQKNLVMEDKGQKALCINFHEVSTVKVQGSHAPGLAQESHPTGSSNLHCTPCTFPRLCFPLVSTFCSQTGGTQLICPFALEAALSHVWGSSSFSA